MPQRYYGAKDLATIEKFNRELLGEPNIDEDDEARIQRKALSLFPLLPTIGITWNF